MNRRHWPWLIVPGVLLVGLGLANEFALDHIMYKYRVSFQWFQLLNEIPPPVFILGFVLSVIGAGAWAFKVSPVKVTVTALTVILGFAILLGTFPFNVHDDWSMYLLFVSIAALLVGAGLLLTAAVRSIISAKRRSRLGISN